MMTNIDNLFESPDEWLNTLPSYQKKLVANLIETNGDLDTAAIKYFDLNTPNTAPFGAGEKKNIFLDRVKSEFYGYMCGHEKYVEQQKNLFSDLKAGRTYIVSGITTAISPYIGASAVYLTPVVVMLLMGVCSIGRNAWCEVQREKNNLKI
ncbi:UNVERIFIED_ORG: hypothetical protein J2X74_005680 [Bacillus sp. 1751]|nr:hypothetical protein [Bacillus sp. 1751]